MNLYSISFFYILNKILSYLLVESKFVFNLVHNFILNFVFNFVLNFILNFVFDFVLVLVLKIFLTMNHPIYTEANQLGGHEVYWFADTIHNSLCYRILY